MLSPQTWPILFKCHTMAHILHPPRRKIEKRHTKGLHDLARGAMGAGMVPKYSKKHHQGTPKSTRGA